MFYAIEKINRVGNIYKKKKKKKGTDSKKIGFLLNWKFEIKRSNFFHRYCFYFQFKYALLLLSSITFGHLSGNWFIPFAVTVENLFFIRIHNLMGQCYDSVRVTRTRRFGVYLVKSRESHMFNFTYDID